MLIAIVRKTDELFMMHDPVEKHTGFFELLPGDSYENKTYSQVVFAEFHEETLTSNELATFSVAEKLDVQNPEKEPALIELCDLELDEVLNIIENLYLANKEMLERERASLPPKFTLERAPSTSTRH